MKKIGFILAALIFLTGCSWGNKEIKTDTPTKKTETFFSNYQKLDEDVLEQLDDVVDNQETLTENQKLEYKELIKKHYQNLEYTIKNEVINGNAATVTTEIKVLDYSKIMKDADLYLETNKNKFNDSEGNYDIALFNEYRIEKLKASTQKVSYTLNITFTKIDNEWIMDSISDLEESKINGNYIY